MKKKAFTLVELLVVIAILAILATVSIVGYTSFIKKGKLSNDETLVTQWNTLLEGKEILAQSDISEKLNSVIDVKEFFTENGTGEDTFTPKSNGYHFYWCEDDNTIYLVDDSNGFTVKYPKTDTNVTSSNSYRLDTTYYTVTTSFTHCSPDKEISLIENGKDIKLIITPDTTFYNPVIENIIVTGGDKKWDSITKTLTIENITSNVSISVISLNNKAEQISPDAPTMNGKTATSITLNTITTTGHGSIEYAKNTTKSTPTEGWQTSVDFTGLISGNTYYFFSRYAGDDDYNSSPASSASEAITTLKTYSIDVTGVTNATGANTNPSSIVEGATEFSLTFTANNNYKLPDSVTVTGATNTSWTKSTGVLVISDPTTNVTITITALLDSVTVTFDKNGGTGGSDNVFANNGEAMPTITLPTRTGYAFSGYYSAVNGGGTKYYNANGSSAKNFDLTADTTLYAYWMANQYTITLDKQSGTGGDAVVSATYGQAMPPLTSLPTRTGYTFDGYYSAVNGGGTKYYNADGTSAKNFDLTADTTLYAKWEEPYKPLLVKIGDDTVKYYPVLGGSNPQPTSFAYSTDGITFTVIAKSGAEYTMSEVAEYAKAGTLYYKGGTVTTVRSDIAQWSNVFNDDGSVKTTYSSSALVIGEEMVTFGNSGTPKVNDVGLNTIYSIYNSSNNFGGQYYGFWANVKQSEFTYYYACTGNYFTIGTSSSSACVLIKRVFN